MIETNIESIETRIEQLKEEKERFKKYSRKSEIKELLKDAEIKKIRELYDIKYGNKNPTHKCEGEKFPSISGGSKISKYTDEWNIPENTIIIARSGSCGSVNMFPEKCLCGSYGFFLEIKDNTTNNIFIHKYLKDNQHEIEELGRGQTVQNLNRDRLYDYKIKYPSPEIQEQCINIYQEKEQFIQSIDDKIEAEKKYIEELKQLSKDIIHNYC
jgi:type I restriction enzyme S subunit